MSPPHRISPAQVLALVVIWGAVAYGLAVGDGAHRVAKAETARLIACR